MKVKSVTQGGANTNDERLYLYSYKDAEFVEKLKAGKIGTTIRRDKPLSISTR